MYMYVHGETIRIMKRGCGSYTIISLVCAKHVVSVCMILVSTSCMQDSSQSVAVVADHIQCCFSSQWFHCHCDCFH